MVGFSTLVISIALTVLASIFVWAVWLIVHEPF